MRDLITQCSLLWRSCPLCVAVVESSIIALLEDVVFSNAGCLKQLSCCGISICQKQQAWRSARFSLSDAEGQSVLGVSADTAGRSSDLLFFPLILLDFKNEINCAVTI